MAFLLDSNVAIDHYRGTLRATQLLQRMAGIPISVSWVTLAELYDGAYYSTNPDEMIVTIRHSVSEFEILLPTDEIAVRFSDVRSFLRRRGQMIENFDLLIAATALVHDLTLVTFNRRHFERIPDLRVYSNA